MKSRRTNKTRRSRIIAAALTVVVLVILFQILRAPDYLATSQDGRIQFIAVKYERGTSFSTAFSSKLEAWVRDGLFKIGFRKVARTSFWMSSPPDSHFVVLEYSGDVDDVKPNLIRGELIQPNGTNYQLLAVGGGTHGLRNRQFAYWVLNGVARLDRQQCQLKVYLPEDSPTILPLSTKSDRDREH